MPQPITLKSYLDTIYLSSRLGLRSSSVQQLRIAVVLWEAWAGPVPLAEITDELLAGWLGSLLEAGRQPATVNSKRRAVLTLLTAAWRKRLIEEVPRDVPRAKEPRRLPAAWTLDQVARLLKECRKQPGDICNIPASAWWTSLILVHYYTAPRIGALLSVRFVDVNLAAGWMLLRAETQKTTADQVLQLAPPAQEAIKQIQQPTRPKLWPWPYHRRTLFSHFRRIVEAAGLPAPRTGRQLFYRLRRTTLTLLASHDLEAARRQAGHYSSATTLRHYVDPRIASAISLRTAELLPDLSMT